jgi:hypothetical protein
VENGQLLIRRRPGAVIELTPAYKDAFHSSLGIVRFLRDSAEMSLSESRVWDLRFHKKP